MPTLVAGLQLLEGTLFLWPSLPKGEATSDRGSLRPGEGREATTGCCCCEVDPDGLNSLASGRRENIELLLIVLKKRQPTANAAL